MSNLFSSKFLLREHAFILNSGSDLFCEVFNVMHIIDVIFR